MGRAAVLLASGKGQQNDRLQQAVRLQTEWQLEHAAAGDIALRVLGTSSFQLLLIDAGLSVVSSSELCRLVRGRPQTAAVPIVVIEFDTLSADREALAFAAGADDYVDGTAETRLVLERVRLVVARHERSGASPRSRTNRYSNGHLYASFEDVFVSIDGRPITMQRLEFALLRYLIWRRNQLVTRHDLLRDVWHGKGSIHSRTIDVHVCRLRRKLGPAGEQIQTLVAQGYRFVDTPSSEVSGAIDQSTNR